MLLADLGVHDEGKYDEEEDEAMVLDPFGGVSLDTLKPGSSVRPETLQTTMRLISDYQSADPEGHDRPIKRRRQKLRKKKETEVLDIVGQLEASQNDGSGMGKGQRTSLGHRTSVADWEADHGSRSERHRRIQQEEQAMQEVKEQKTRRFDKALERANLQAMKLKLLKEGDEVRRQFSRSEKTR